VSDIELKLQSLERKPRASQASKTMNVRASRRPRNQHL
jgi:hypothetical protein